MSHTELIEIVDRTTPEDRLFLSAYLEHLACAADPEHGRVRWYPGQIEVSGNEVSLEDARKLHETLAARGL